MPTLSVHHTQTQREEEKKREKETRSTKIFTFCLDINRKAYIRFRQMEWIFNPLLNSMQCEMVKTFTKTFSMQNYCLHVHFKLRIIEYDFCGMINPKKKVYLFYILCNLLSQGNSSI